MKEMFKRVSFSDAVYFEKALPEDLASREGQHCKSDGKHATNLTALAPDKPLFCISNGSAGLWKDTT